MANPASASPASDKSCFNWVKDKFCQDWSQPIESVGCIGATGVSILGCVTGNGPLAGMGAVAAATNCLAMSRMACLGDTIRLNKSSELLHQQVQKLQTAQGSQQATIDQLQKAIDQLKGQNDELIRQGNAIQTEKNESLKQVTELTQKLAQLQAQYQSNVAQYQTTLKEMAANHAAMAAAAAGISDENRRLIDSQSQLGRHKDNLSAAAREANEQNVQMKKHLAELEIQCKSLQQEIGKLQQEKAALDHLLTAEKDASSTLLAQIQQNKADNIALQTLLAQTKLIVTNPPVK